MPVEDLLEAVWGDDVSATASSTLETHVWRLRWLLEPDENTHGHTQVC